MHVLRSTLPVLVSLCLSSCSGAASNPAALAKELQKALDSGNFEAARSLADLGGAPAELHFAYLSNVLDCSGAAKCTVSTAPLDAEFRQALNDDAKKEGADVPQAEGLIVLAMRSDDGTESGTMKMPYAKVGGQYKLATLHLTPAELTRRRAQPSESLLKQMLADGIYDNASGARRTDWETAATKLPAGGGEPGAALVQQTTKMSAAVDAKDPNAAMNAGGQWALLVFADKSYDGKPIALEQRQRKLQVQSLRMLRDVKVLGGYELGDDAVLLIEARDGVGWVQRGAVLISRDGGAWDGSIAGRQMVSYPQ
jgi:hypothetical protein